MREDCGGASTPLLWELPGEGSQRPGLTSVPAAHSDPLLEPRANWNGKSVTLSYFPVVFKHNEIEPSGRVEGMVDSSGWCLLARRHSSRRGGQNRKLRAHAFDCKPETESMSCK